MDSVRKLFRSVSSLFSSTPMPVPAAQQSHVSDTYCDRNASQDMASTVGGTGTSPIAISDSVRPSIIRGSQVGTFEGDNRHKRRSPSRSRLFDTNESQDNYQHSPEQVFRTPNVSFERGTRELPQWDEETEVKQIYRPDRNNSRTRIARDIESEDSRDEIFYLAPEYSDRQDSYRMEQDYYHTPTSRPTSRGRLRQNSPRLSNLRRRLDDDSYYERQSRQPAQVRITNPGRDERWYENRDFGVMHNRKPRNADLFDDKNWDFDEYMAHFMSVARWNGWSYAEMADQLAMNLRGSARTVLGILPEHEVRDFDSLKAALTRRYSPLERRSAYRNEFQHRRRSKGENLVEYGCVLRKLAAKAHPSLLPNQREVLIVDQFISGLNSTEIRRHVSFAHPENLDEAIDLAVEFESFEGNQSIKKPSGTTATVVAGVTEENSGTSDSKLQATLLGELVKACKENAEAIGKLNQAIQNLSKKQSNSGNREQGKDQNFRRYRKDKPRGACFLCSQTDHYANLCPRNPKNAGSQTVKPSNGTGTGDNLNQNGLGSGPTVQPK